MNIHIYLSPTSPAVREIPNLKSVVRSRYGDANVNVTIDDGLPEDCCFIDGNSDHQDIQEIYFLLNSLTANCSEDTLAVA